MPWPLGAKEHSGHPCLAHTTKQAVQPCLGQVMAGSRATGPQPSPRWQSTWWDGTRHHALSAYSRTRLFHPWGCEPEGGWSGSGVPCRTLSDPVSRPKAGPQAAQGQPKVSQNSIHSRPKVGPKWIRSRPKASPKSAQSWPKVCPKSVQSRPKVDLKSAQSRPKAGPKSAQSRLKAGPNLAQRRPKVSARSAQSAAQARPG